LFSYVAGAEGNLSNNVTEYECEYEFEYEYNHADIVYVYAAHAKSHHSFTHTLTHIYEADTPDFYLEHKSIAYFVASMRQTGARPNKRATEGRLNKATTMTTSLQLKAE